MSSEDSEVDISTEKNGTILKKIIKAGIPEGNPLKGNVVLINYIRKVFDVNHRVTKCDERTSFKFTLGMDDVYPDLHTAVFTMMKGEKSVVTCLPAYGFKGENIPHDGKVLLEIELLSWKPDDIITGNASSLFEVRKVIPHPPKETIPSPPIAPSSMPQNTLTGEGLDVDTKLRAAK